MLYKLIEYLSLANSICKNIPMKFFCGEKPNDIKKLFINFDKLREIYNKNELIIFKIWNVFDIYEILYDTEEIINIDKNITDLSSNFYLTLLIQKANNVINYQYNLEYLQNILHQINSNINLNFLNFILSKILYHLIDNYRENSNLNNSDLEIQQELSEMEEKVITFIEKNNIFINLKEEIMSINIGELYSKIIYELVINNTIDNFEKVYNIVKEIEIEKIDFTESMFIIFVDLFYTEKKIVDKYSILEEKDFGDINKINFYFIFLKYIFKQSIFIYNFKLFLETRKFIINKIRLGYNLNSFILLQDNNLIEREKYIIKSLLDSDYYFEKLNNNNKFNKKESVISNESEIFSHDSISIQSEREKEQSFIDHNHIEQRSDINSSDNIEYLNSSTISNQNKSSQFNIISSQIYNDPSNTNIIRFKKIINNIKENKEKDEKEETKHEFIIEINSGYISWGIAKNIYIYNKEYNCVKIINLKNEILNNLVVEESNKEGIFYIIACLKYKLRIFTIKNMKHINEIKDFTLNEIYEEMSSVFRISKDNYLICYKNRICFISESFNDRITAVQEQKFFISSIVSVININENYIGLKACDFIDKNNNKIKFFNIFKGELCPFEIKGYSLIFSYAGMSIMPSFQSKNENKVLLCACKKYSQDGKNGILLINTSNLENEKVYTYFYDTKNFEVYCFCPILIFNYEKMFDDKYNYIDTDYFLVGGFDSEKGIGGIKLYKIIFDNEKYENKIEFIQDLDDFKEFKYPVNCIIQDKKSLYQNILVTCLDGNIYLFSGPNIEYYLRIDKNIKDEVSYVDFFK